MTKKHLLLFGVILLSCLTIFGQSINAQTLHDSKINGRSLAVIPFHPSGEQAENVPSISTRLQSSLSSDMSQLKQVKILPARTVNQRLKRHELLEVNPNSGRNAERIGRVLNTELLLIGTYQIAGDSILISAIFYDHKNNKIIAQQQSVRGEITNLSELQVSLGEKLLRRVNYPLPVNWPNSLQKKSSEPSEFDLEKQSQPSSSKYPTSYFGMSLGQMSYDEKGQLLGIGYDASYSLTSFGTITGIRFNQFFSFEGRLGFSGSGEQDIFGVPVEAGVSHYFGGFAKFKVPAKNIQPYGLLGYTAGEIEACGTTCETIESNQFSYGGGLQIPVVEQNAVFLEYLDYGEENNQSGISSSKGSLSELKFGLLLTFQ